MNFLVRFAYREGSRANAFRSVSRLFVAPRREASEYVKMADLAIVKQRPCTAKGAYVGGGCDGKGERRPAARRGTGLGCAIFRGAGICLEQNLYPAEKQIAEKIVQRMWLVREM
jgi:hypothetical protein